MSHGFLQNNSKPTNIIDCVFETLWTDSKIKMIFNYSLKAGIINDNKIKTRENKFIFMINFIPMATSIVEILQL